MTDRTRRILVGIPMGLIATILVFLITSLVLVVRDNHEKTRYHAFMIKWLEKDIEALQEDGKWGRWKRYKSDRSEAE